MFRGTCHSGQSRLGNPLRRDFGRADALVTGWGSTNGFTSFG